METLKKIIAWGKLHPLLIILALAATLRLVALSSVPPSLNWDEVSMGYSAYSVMHTGKDEWGEFLPLLFRSYGEWKSPLYIYLIIPFIKIFGLNAWGVRLPAALAGIATVYLTYLLGRRLFFRRVGLWAAFLLAVSPWHLMLSRPGFEAGVALMLYLWGIWTFLRAVETQELKYWLFAGIAFGLGPHTYNSAKLVVPLLVIYLVWYFRRQLSVRRLAVFGAILAFFAFPILINLSTGRSQGRYKQVGLTTDMELTTQFYEYRKTFPLPAPLNRVIFSKYSFVLVKGFQNWVLYFSPSFLLTEGGPRAQHNIPYRGVLYLTEAIALFFGLKALGRSSGLGRSLPLVIIGLGFIPAAITKDPYHVLRSILTLPGWQLLAALGIVHLQTIKSKFLTPIFYILSVEVIAFMAIYFLWYPRAFARDWQYGYEQAVKFALAHQDEYQQIIFTKWYGEPQLFLAFYGQLDPIEFQRENQALLRYESMGLPWLDQLNSYQIGKFTFKYLDWNESHDSPHTLFVGKADDFWSDTPIRTQIKFPSGDVAFNIVEP